MELEKLIESIQKKLQSSGGEPEYLEIRTPIEDDNLGWFAVIQWMHHDGLIQDSHVFRHKFLHGVLQLVLDYLIERETVCDLHEQCWPHGGGNPQLPQ